MNFKLTCDCGNTIDLKPTTNGQHIYLSKNFVNNNSFRVEDYSIDTDVSLSHYPEFIQTLAKVDDEQVIQEYLEDEICSNVNVDTVLQELRIDCRACDSYIVLTDF